jgi:hypothetical protein
MGMDGRVVCQIKPSEAHTDQSGLTVTEGSEMSVRGFQRTVKSLTL